MKRVSIFLFFVTMFVLGSCTSSSHKSELKTDIDTLSYFWGMARSEGIKNFLLIQAGVDTSHMDAFYKGFREGTKHYGPKEVAYLEGMRIAHLINNQWFNSLNEEIFLGDSTRTVNRFAILSGFYQGVKNGNDMSIMNAQSYSQVKLDVLKESFIREKYADIIAESEKFLEENKNKPGVKTTESGLQYKIIKEGSGPIPDDRASVKVNYRGTLVNGKEFDSSYKSVTQTFHYVSGSFKGWTEALKMMPVGSKWELYIPHDLAYGPMGQPNAIPPYATLIYELELLEIESK